MEEEKKDIDEIEEGKLWLGSFDPGNVNALKEKGITKILSLMDGNSSNFSYKEQGFNQKIINIMDYDTENIIQYFGECINFIEGKDKVLVHCIFGKSRSASIVVAYLMWKEKRSLDDALNFVNQKRPIAVPNTGFQKQLKIFEELLKDNKYNLSKIDFKKVEWDYKS